MKVYDGSHLTITLEKDNDRIVLFWKSSPESIDSFKCEMVKYTTLCKKYKPSQAMCLNFNLRINFDQSMKIWSEKNVNIPCKDYGMEKLAFVVNQDVLVHTNLINAFNEMDSCLYPKHFATEENARNWLNNDEIIVDIDNKPEIIFEGTDSDGNSIFKIKSSSPDIAKTMVSLQNVLKKDDFIKNNISKYLLLTKRERQILHLYAKGHSFLKITDGLNISSHTVRTHWRNVKRKLNIYSNEQLFTFAKEFNPRKYENQ